MNINRIIYCNSKSTTLANSVMFNSSVTAKHVTV